MISPRTFAMAPLTAAALLATPAHAPDCQRIQDPDQRSDRFASTR